MLFVPNISRWNMLGIGQCIYIRLLSVENVGNILCNMIIFVLFVDKLLFSESTTGHAHITQYHRLFVNIKFVFFRFDQHGINNSLL